LTDLQKVVLCPLRFNAAINPGAAKTASAPDTTQRAFFRSPGENLLSALKERAVLLPFSWLLHSEQLARNIGRS
jgi:hypothetical protein